jgi:hypothetical protein
VNTLAWSGFLAFFLFTISAFMRFRGQQRTALQGLCSLIARSLVGMACLLMGIADVASEAAQRLPSRTREHWVSFMGDD